MLKIITKKEWLLVLRNFLVELPIEILAFIVVPIAVAFCKKDDQKLPKWASWWDEERYGINGEMYDENGKLICRDGGHCGPDGRFPAPKNKTWYARVRWLLRNRIGVFSTKINGIKYADIKPETIEIQGDIETPSYSGSKGTTWGLVRAELNNGKKVFGFFGNIVWCKWFYVRLYLGYKLFDVASIGQLPVENRREAFNKYLADPNSKIYAKSVWAIHFFRFIRKK